MKIGKRIFGYRGTSIALELEEAVRRLGRIRKDTLQKTLDNLDIREFLARMGVGNQNAGAESIQQKLRRWVPATD
jgi:hypothetical protein